MRAAGGADKFARQHQWNPKVWARGFRAKIESSEAASTLKVKKCSGKVVSCIDASIVVSFLPGPHCSVCPLVVYYKNESGGRSGQIYPTAPVEPKGWGEGLSGEDEE